MYARISDDRTGLAAGVDRQVADATDLCTRRGWHVVDTYVDNDISASRYSTKTRPAYTRLLAAIEAREVDAVAVYDVDRLYRRPAELEALIDLAEHVVIASVQGDLRLDTSDGRAIARVLAAMAAKASDDTSRRVKRAHLHLAQAGLPVGGGRRPYGFEVDRITHRPDEAARLREAATRLLAGDTLTAICTDWNARGVPTAQGTRWETSALRRMLEAPRVAGLRAIRGEVVGDAVWAPILDRGTWEATRAVLAARKVSMPDGWAARTYLLSGLLVCAACGRRFGAAPSNSRGYRYRRYACVKARGGCGTVGISADGADALVVDAVLARVAAGGPLEAPVIDDGTDALVASLVAAEADLAALAGELAAGRLTVAAYGAASHAVTARIEDLRRQVATRRAAGAGGELAASADPTATWEVMAFPRRRAALAAAVDHVVVTPRRAGLNRFDPDRLTVVWRGGPT